MNRLDKSVLLRGGEMGPVERIGWYIPFLGWSVSASLWNRRNRPVVRAVLAELASRPSPQFTYLEGSWEAYVAQVVLTAVGKEMGWRPPNFGPDDHAVVAFWSHQDGLDDVCAIQRIEMELDLSEGAFDWEAAWGHTLGELVTNLAAASTKSPA